MWKATLVKRMHAISKYLEQYAHVEATELQHIYRCALVIPYFNEPLTCIDHLKNLVDDVLLIAVVNNISQTDESEKAQNQALINELQKRPHTVVIDKSSQGCELPTPGGVGLARKIGCDTALSLYHQGLIESPWIHTSDADAIFPAEYTYISNDIPKGAVVYAFKHMSTGDTQHDVAMSRYEKALHAYADGLRLAGSPYAYISIGSCLALHAESYAAVRGFSAKRQAGEDFYILNNIRRIAEVTALEKPIIQLSPRLSTRVPFGTGQAVAKLIKDGPDAKATGFATIYPQEAFEALKIYLKENELNIDAPRSRWQNFDALKTLKWVKNWCPE